MKLELFKYLGWVLLFISLWFKGCGETKEVIVKVPEIRNKYIAKKPTHIDLSFNKNDFLSQVPKEDKTRLKTKINTLEEENKKLLDKFVSTKDSLESIKLYKEAIQINSFISVFKDDYLDLTITGLVRGEVQDIQPKYVIKEREIPIEKPNKKHKILASLELGNNMLLSEPLFKAGLGFQNKKGNIIRLGYTANEQFTLGYDVALIKF